MGKSGPAGRMTGVVAPGQARCRQSRDFCVMAHGNSYPSQKSKTRRERERGAGRRGGRRERREETMALTNNSHTVSATTDSWLLHHTTHCTAHCTTQYTTPHYPTLRCPVITARLDTVGTVCRTLLSTTSSTSSTVQHGRRLAPPLHRHGRELIVSNIYTANWCAPHAPSHYHYNRGHASKARNPTSSSINYMCATTLS